MTPEARLQSSIEMSEAIEADPRPADAVVHDWLKGKRFIRAKDRRWLTQSVYDRMRHQRRLDWWLERVKMGSYPRGRALAERILIYGIDLGELAQICSGARFGPPRLDEGERKGLERLVGQSLDHPEQPAAVKGECPDWLFPLFGAEAESELAALAKEAPLDLRVNRLKATREKAQERLFDEGIKTEATLLSPLCLRTHDRPNVASSAIRGYTVRTILPERPGQPARFVARELTYHVLFTAETHNFPSGMAPFPGAETGTGGRIRDGHATGHGSLVVAGTAAYCVGNLRIPGYEQPWEDAGFAYPDNLAAALPSCLQQSSRTPTSSCRPMRGVRR